MKSFFMSILFTGMLLYVNAQDPAYPPAPAAPQNITAAEYFIDTDPGIGVASAIAVSQGVNIPNLPVSINITGLSNGVHRVMIRTKNNQGIWSITGIKDFLYDFNPVYNNNAAAQNIIAAEYFIDTDPGFGNATPIPVTAGINLSDVPVSINTNGLSNGVHRLFIRSKSNEGSWSICNIKDFIVDFNFAYPTAPAPAQNIIAAEYFINTDPGFGKGTPVEVTAGIDISNLPVVVNTSSLQPATTNRLFIRTKNNEGVWSIAHYKVFVMDITNDPAYPAPPPTPQNIVAAEYFINSDPGAGSGTPITLTPSPDINNIPVVVNTSSLQPATTNQLFIRTKNNEGRWSITNVKQFAVTITSDPAYIVVPQASQNITAAEYFIDTDPGTGKGTTITISPGTDLSNIPVSVNTTGLTNGQHQLFIRTKSNEGYWSITNRAAFFTDLLGLSADSLQYGDVPLNTTVARNLIVTNNSAVSQTINAIVLAAPYTSNFTGQRTIAPGAKDTIIVSFTPAATGTFIQGLQLQTSAGNYNAGLSGAGIAQVPSWTISPASGHNYGNIPVSTTATFIFSIQNTGNVPATLGNVTVTDAAFVPAFTAGTVIPANGSISLPVAFTPAVVTPYSSQLKIESSTPGVNFVTTVLSGSGYNPGAPPVLQFVSVNPYSSISGVNPAAGQSGDYTYKILYKSSNNRAPQTGSPKVAIDLNGDHIFTGGNEGMFTMAKETPGTDYATGVVYTYTYTHSNNTSTAGYQFSAIDDNGNSATTINTAYVSGPVITDQQLDLRLFANDISFSKNNPQPGETFTVSARISNNTALPATNVPVKYYRDTILIGSDVIPAVNAFSSATISRTLNFGAEGFFPIKVWIDSSNTLADINPLNNYAIRPIVVGSPNLPGGINVTTSATMQQCPQVKVLITGNANYYGTGSPQAVAGAEVTINTGTQVITTTTNSNGYYSYLLTGITCGGTFTYNVSITDFTFTSSLATGSIALPCPAPGACSPAPSMGGAYAIASSNPCANIVGGTGTVTLRLQYRERNLANFWNGWDEIENDTLKIFKDGVLIETHVAANHTNAPGNVVNYPVYFPLTSTTPSVYTAELKYVYVEYFQIPGAFYHGVRQQMSHTAGTTITPVDNKPDLTIQNFASTSFTSFKFNDANIKCVAAGSHQVKIYDSIPGGSFVLIDTRTVSSLAAGMATVINYSNSAITSGTHFIKVVTDANKTVAETDEANNEFIFTIVVPDAELTVTKLNTSPTELNIGSPTRFTAIIKNTGRSAGTFNVRFTVAGVQVGALKSVASLNENSTVQVKSDAYTVTNASPDCGLVVMADADFGNLIPEQSNSNNTMQVTLGTDLAPYQLSSEVGSAANPAVVRVFTTTQFYPAVRNIGERDASDVTVRFTLNGNWIGSDTVNNVKAGEIFASHASFTRMFTTAGNYVVKVTTDTVNAICENSEANNQGDFHIRVVESKPDLEVLSQYISPSALNPNIGQTIILVGTVKNMGGNVTTPSVLRFLVDDIQLGADVPINALAPRRDTTVAATANYSSIIPGVKVMKIVADPLNTMTEEREDNNLSTRAMIVGDAPDMARSAAGAISFNPSGFVSGDSVTVNFSIKNLGPTDGTAWVKFYIKDSTFATTALDSVAFSLASGATITASKRMLFDIHEGYVITEIYNCSPMEFDLLNNNDTLHFTTVAKMKQAITINGNLDMKQGAPALLPEWIGGKIMLGNYDLTVNGIIQNFDTAHFIVTNGTGKLKFVNTQAQNIFPVGATLYNPNFVQLNNTGTPDNFSVRVLSYVLKQGTGGDTILTGNVNRTWLIDEQTPGGSNATLSLAWRMAEEQAGFDRSLSRTAHYTSAWQLGDLGAAVTDSVGFYSRTQTGYTSFSPFTVTSDLGGALPLHLLQFTADRQGTTALLNWKTSNEINTGRFEIQHSTDGLQFNNIGIVAATNKPGINNYRFTHPAISNGANYYRLKMIDVDGKFTYSAVKIIRLDDQALLQVLPNPVHQVVTVKGLEANGTIEILTADGKLVKRLVTTGNTISIDMGNIAGGIYVLRYQNNNVIQQQKIIKE